MLELFTALACFIGDLPFWQQVVVSTPFLLCFIGLIYLGHCGLWTLIAKAADALGIEIITDDEDFDASWMDAREWRRSR